MITEERCLRGHGSDSVFYHLLQDSVLKYAHTAISVPASANVANPDGSLSTAPQGSCGATLGLGLMLGGNSAKPESTEYKNPAFN